MRPVVLLLCIACGCGREATQRTGSARVVSQVVFADEELWHMGPQVQARVVGVSPMADDARYSDAVGLWPAALARPTGAEAIAALTPDLVITAEFTAAETRAALEQLGIRTLELSGWNGFADYRRHVTDVAAALELPTLGEQRIASFDAELAALHERFSGGTHPGIVSWEEGSVPGAGTSFSDAAAAAGFSDVAASHGIVGHTTIGVETLVAWDPEYIVVTCEDDCPAREREIAGRPGIAATRAAKGGGVIAIEAHHLYSVGAGMLEVVRRLGERRLERTP